MFKTEIRSKFKIVWKWNCSNPKIVQIRKLFKSEIVQIWNLFKSEICSNFEFVQIWNLFKPKNCSNFESEQNLKIEQISNLNEKIKLEQFSNLNKNLNQNKNSKSEQKTKTGKRKRKPEKKKYLLFSILFLIIYIHGLKKKLTTYCVKTVLVLRWPRSYAPVDRWTWDRFRITSLWFFVNFTCSESQMGLGPKLSPR
jgi:hypothetical protein